MELEDEIFHRMICAWTGRDPETVDPMLGPANKITKQGWLRVFKEAVRISREGEKMNDELFG